MFWNNQKRQYEPHPDCKCGQGEGWTVRGINRPCYCHFLRPLDANGQPIPYPLFDELRKRLDENATQGSTPKA